MKFSRISIYVLFLILLSACATPLPTRAMGEFPQPPNGYANLVLLRQNNQFASLVWPAVLINAKRAAPLPNNTFTIVAIRPGTHELTMEKEQSWTMPWTAKTTITVEAGKSYFLSLSLLSKEVSGLVFAGPTPIVTRERVSQGQQWDLLSESTGRQLIVIHDFVDPFVKTLD